MHVFVLVLIICAITIPLIVGLILIVRNAVRGDRRRRGEESTAKDSTQPSISKEPTGLEDLESQTTKSGSTSGNSPKKLKQIVLETYRSNRRSRTSLSDSTSTARRPPLPPNTRVVKYKQSKPKPLSIDDNGNIV